MIYAVKENKSYQVGEDKNLQNAYLHRGYDLTDETGTIIQYSPEKTIPYSQYMALLKENDSLRKQLESKKK